MLLGAQKRMNSSRTWWIQQGPILIGLPPQRSIHWFKLVHRFFQMIEWLTLRIIKNESRKRLSNSALHFSLWRKMEAHDLKTHREFLTDSYLPTHFSKQWTAAWQFNYKRKENRCVSFSVANWPEGPHHEHIPCVIYQSPTPWCWKDWRKEGRG